jgi:hypothetical protein
MTHVHGCDCFCKRVGYCQIICRDYVLCLRQQLFAESIVGLRQNLRPHTSSALATAPSFLIKKKTQTPLIQIDPVYVRAAAADPLSSAARPLRRGHPPPPPLLFPSLPSDSSPGQPHVWPDRDAPSRPRRPPPWSGGRRACRPDEPRRRRPIVRTHRLQV